MRQVLKEGEERGTSDGAPFFVSRVRFFANWGTSSGFAQI